MRGQPEKTRARPTPPKRLARILRGGGLQAKPRKNRRGSGEHAGGSCKRGNITILDLGICYRGTRAAKKNNPVFRTRSWAIHTLRAFKHKLRCDDPPALNKLPIFGPPPRKLAVPEAVVLLVKGPGRQTKRQGLP